jgi:hypothetical protein
MAPLSSLQRQFDESSTPLVVHVVAPQTTDPAIDRALDDHYVWLDTSARTNHKLFLFMHGAGQKAGLFQLVGQEAARLGYHVIGLTYQSSGLGFTARCPTDLDPATCYENARLEILTGNDFSPIFQLSPANSIDNRFVKLLQYLEAQYPGEGWNRFLLGDGTPSWSQIAVGGHSQGGGEAAIIAKIRVVARVVLFSSVTDTVGPGAPGWETTHVTPTARYWGIAHDRDLAFFRAIRAGWDSIGMAAFGAPVAPETSEPPYNFTHILVTDVTPVGGFVGMNAHGSPSNDQNTPLDANGVPLLRAAWRYLLAAKSGDDDIADRDEP